MLVFIYRVSLSCFPKISIPGKIKHTRSQQIIFGKKKKAGKLVPAQSSYVDLYEGY